MNLKINTNVWVNINGGQLRDYNKVSVLFLSEPFYNQEDVTKTIPLTWDRNESRFTGLLNPATTPITLFARKEYTQDEKRCQSLVVIVDQKIVGSVFRFCMSDYFKVF